MEKGRGGGGETQGDEEHPSSGAQDGDPWPGAWFRLWDVGRTVGPVDYRGSGESVRTVGEAEGSSASP
ncbi:hypothetical protein NHX12_002394 [Muraenolepis orangiensis]|uniref:Uncharacterized protein n=1 Tax=Muraenolepis orangiensis TaxID=630683 RepID=A0A9Q0DZE4_9TELE|nr:hypothetical protein NHX12_002394 [Muraenolepis orangiensis]